MTSSLVDALDSLQAGIMEEMVDDTLEGLDQDEELEEEANEEVDKVLFELTDGKFGKIGEVSTTLPVSSVYLQLWIMVILNVAPLERSRGRSPTRGGDGQNARATRGNAQRVILVLGRRCHLPHSPFSWCSGEDYDTFTDSWPYSTNASREPASWHRCFKLCGIQSGTILHPQPLSL